MGILEALETLEIVGAHETDHRRGEATGGIGPLRLGGERDAGQVELLHEP